MVTGLFQGGGHAHNAGHVFRPRPLPALLGAPFNEGGEGNALADIEGAHPFGAVEFMAGEGEHVDVLPAHVNLQVAGGLHRVGVEEDVSLPAQPADVGNGLNGANLVVGIHDGHKTCVVRDGLGHLLGGDAAGLMDIQQGDGEALLLQLLQGVENGVVLKGSGNDVGLSPRLSPAGGGENGLVVRLAATRGKVDLLRPAVKAVRHGLPGLCQGFSGLLAQGVQGGGIAVCFPQVGEHGVQGGAAELGGGGVVCVYHGATSLLLNSY